MAEAPAMPMVTPAPVAGRGAVVEIEGVGRVVDGGRIGRNHVEILVPVRIFIGEFRPHLCRGVCNRLQPSRFRIELAHFSGHKLRLGLDGVQVRNALHHSGQRRGNPGVRRVRVELPAVGLEGVY